MPAHASEVSAEHEPVRYFYIKSKNLSKALNEFAVKSDSEIFYSSEIVENKRSHTVQGTYTPGDALKKILQGTGLKYSRVDENVFLVHLIFTTSTVNANLTNEQLSDANDINQELEEIVVTASKRSQYLQDVPASITALDYTELDRRALLGMEDYLRTIPGVNQVDRGVGRNAIIIRGVAADPAFEDATVGVYFDEVPLTGRAYFGSVDLKLVDMERVEVLRGPQGTLYGAGSLAGTVRNIPVEVNLAVAEGNVTAGYSEMAGEGSGGNKKNVTVNIPLIDNQLAVRASAYTFNNSGYIKNIAASNTDFAGLVSRSGASHLAVDEHDVGRSDYTGARIRLLWEPSEQLSLTANYLTQDLEQDGWPEMEAGLGKFRQRRLQLMRPISGGEKLVDDFELGNVVVKYDLGWSEMMISTSVFKEFALRNADLSRLFSTLTSHTPSRDADVFIEEIRFVSTVEGPLQVLTGLYYEDNEWLGKVFLISANNTLDNPVETPELLLDYQLETDIEQFAFYGNVIYEFNDYFSITAGGRYFGYTRRDISKARGRFVEDGRTSPVSDVKGSETGFNSSINITYTPNQDTLFYAQYSEGFRLGAPQKLVPIETCDLDKDGRLDGTNAPIDAPDPRSDKLTSLELGGKYSPDKRFTLNGSIYQNNWGGIPVNAQGNCGLFVVINAGEARTYGIDVESSLYLFQNLRLDIGLSYTDAELAADVPSLNAVKGNRLAGSMHSSVNVALQYDVDIFGSDAFVRLDYSAVGRFYGNVQERGPVLGNYHLFHLKSGVKMENISVEFYVNNLTNSDKLVWADGLLLYPLKPRTAGLNFIYHF